MAQPSRQPPPDVYAKQGTATKGMAGMSNTNQAMMGQGYGQ